MLRSPSALKAKQPAAGTACVLLLLLIEDDVDLKCKYPAWMENKKLTTFNIQERINTDNI